MKAYIQPPQMADAAGGPIAYIWGTRLAASRQTAPRSMQGLGGGQQQFAWDASVSIAQAFDQDDQNLSLAFPLVIDQVMATLCTTPLQRKGVWLTDPDTGNKTQLLSIGERFSLDYVAVQTTGTAGEGLWIFGCDLTFPVEELVSFQLGTFYNPVAPSA